MYKKTASSAGLFAPTAVLRAMRSHQSATATGGGSSSFDPPLFMGSSTPNVISTTETIEELEKAELTHVVPSKLGDHASIHGIRLLRWVSDKFFKERYIHRGFMLVGVGSAPSAAMLTVEHFRSHFKDTAPKGMRVNLSAWENRRMHHTIVNQLSPPNLMDKCCMAVMQVLHYVLFFILSIFSPKTAYRLAAYLAEEATVILTHMVNDIDLGKVQDVDAPSLAVDYWGIQAQASGSASIGATAASVLGNSASGEAVDNVAETAARSTSVESSIPASLASSRNDDNDTASTSSKISETIETQSVGGESSSTAAQSDRPPSTVTNGFTRDSRPRQQQPKRLPRLREVVLLMRADEMVHRDLCHKIADAYDRAGKEVDSDNSK